MAVLVVGSEATFAALRPRLFGRRRVSPEAAEKVAAALRRANPHADLDALLPGTVLTIPDLEEVAVPDELALDDSVSQTVAAMHEAVLGTLNGVANDAEALGKDDMVRARHLLGTLKSSAVRKAVGDDHVLAGQVERAQRSVSEEDAGVKARLAAVARAREEWAGELDGLKGLLP